MNKGIERALRKLNIEYKTFFWQFENWEEDQKIFAEIAEGNRKRKLYNGSFCELCTSCLKNL